MYKNVIMICAEHQPVWTTMPAFVTAYDKLVSKTEELSLVGNEQSSKTVGTKKLKDAQHKAIAEKANLVAESLRSLAFESGNIELAEQLHFSHTALLKSNSEKVLQLIDRIVVAADAHAAQLVDRGIAQSQIDELPVVKEQLALAFTQMRNAVVHRKQQTELLAERSKEITHLLKNSMDKLVNVIRPGHPEFYALYKAARTIVDLKGKSNKKGAAPVVPPAVPGGELPPPAQEPGGSK